MRDCTSALNPASALNREFIFSSTASAVSGIGPSDPFTTYDDLFTNSNIAECGITDCYFNNVGSCAKTNGFTSGDVIFSGAGLATAV